MDLLPDALLRRFFLENDIVLVKVRKGNAAPYSYVAPENKRDGEILLEEIAAALNSMYFSHEDCVRTIESLFEKHGGIKRNRD